MGAWLPAALRGQHLTGPLMGGALALVLFLGATARVFHKAQRDVPLMGGALALVLFLGATARMFHKAQRDVASGRYTRWVYYQVFALVPALPFSPLARRLALVNGLALPIAIHCFYSMTNYHLLRELGDRIARDEFGVQRRMPFAVLIAGDMLAHFGPWLIAKGVIWALADPPVRWESLSRVWVGCLTGFCHSTYCWWLTGQWDPGTIYDLKKTKYSMGRVRLAWFGVFVGHIFVSWWQVSA